MNPSHTATLPMTDLGRLLTGRDAETHLTRLSRVLEDEERRVRARMAAGLNQEEYLRAGRRVVALQHADSVLKSLRIFLSA
jgi:hypothetical protein